MLFGSLLIGFLVAFTVQGFNNDCTEDEYSTFYGKCCPKCYAGTVVLRDCTDQIATSCIPCEKGTFMSQSNGLNDCFPCTSCDTEGLFVKQACTAKTDTVCNVLSGYVCRSLSEVTGCSLAERHSICVPGQQIKEPGTNVTDTVCENCPEGHSSMGVKCTALDEIYFQDLSNDLVQPEDSTNDVVQPEDSTNGMVQPEDSTHDVVQPEDSTNDVVQPEDSSNDWAQPGDSSNDVVHSNSAKNYDLSYHDLLYLPLLIIVSQLFSYFL